MKAIQNTHYFDPAIYELEQQTFFNNQRVFLGHLAQIPNKGDYFVPPHLDQAIALVHATDGLQVLFNSCRHRQAMLLEGQGNTQTIVCPVHCWAYDLAGKLLRCPGFKVQADQNLFQVKGIEIQDKIISKGYADTFRDAMNHEVLQGIDFLNYTYLEHTSSQYGVNWKEYADLFLDNNHINYFHPGLRALVNTGSIEWFWGEDYSIHSLKLNERKRKMSPPFQHYLDTYQAHFPEKKFEYGAIWLVVYPNIYIEIWQDFLSIAVITPTGLRNCRNDEYIFCHSTIAGNQALIAAFSNAFGEVETEDAQILSRIAKGRSNLQQWGMPDAGPYQMKLEAGVAHFHAYWTAHIL